MKVLFGYDGSKAAMDALKDLAKASLPPKAQAYVLTAAPAVLPLDVLALDPSGFMAYSPAMAEAVSSAGDPEVKAAATAEKAALLLGSLMPGWAVAFGTSGESPAHGILHQAESWGPDLIVMGSHGWSGFGKILLGSVADNVLRHAHTDVRIGRKGTRKRSGPPKLIVGFDGSPHAEAAIAEVARRHWPAGTKVHLLAATAMHFPLSEMTEALRLTLEGKASEARAWPRLERALDDAATRLGKRGLKVTSRILVEDPRKALCEEAERMGADCIFLGSRGLSGPKRFLLGSVSAAVAAHAPCSVEIIRGADAEK